VNESILEYVRLKQQLFDLYQRQGEQSWAIIERVIEDLQECQIVEQKRTK